MMTAAAAVCFWEKQTTWKRLLCEGLGLILVPSVLSLQDSL